MLSRRAFLATSAATAIAGAFGRQVFVHARQAPQAPPPTPVFTAIRRNVGYFTMRGGTIGYLIDPRGIVVVDTQFAPEGKACLDGLNLRSGSRPVDRLINTHHHPDHIGGNISFKGAAKSVVAHARAAEHMRQPPGGAPPATEQLYPDTTFADSWREQVATNGCARSSTDRRTRAGTWWSRSSAPTSRTWAT
jgi:cyclase